ncbi:MAG TPA: hypothetical protein VHT02_02770 [Methylocella sp.]|nr:hypothetical protein [Methylocella sp.]
MNKADPGWPKWAAILRNWLVVVTGLLAAITAFLFAIGKAGDAYQSAYEGSL